MTAADAHALTDAALARTVASEAGALLWRLMRAQECAGRGLGDRGDREANRLILDRLGTARPDDFVLSEEAVDDQRRCTASRVWIVDPLDGTREFCELRDDWAVHIGLAIDGDPVAGAVALPAIDQLWASDDVVAPAPAAPARPRMVVSRSRAPALAEQVARALDAELVPMGSAGAKAMAVVLGDADAYVHAGGQHEWDSAAPVAVAAASGLHCSRLDGSPLRYNQPDPWLPDLLVCRPELAERVIGALR